MKASFIWDFIKYICFRLIVLCCALIFGGCAHFYYLPNNLNVPLFKEKYEFHGSTSLGGGFISTGTDVQTALSLTNHLAVMANYMSSKYYSNDPEDDNSIKYNYFEGAAGYFKPFNEFWVFEVYGGFGSGKQHHEYYAWPDNTYRGNADLPFVKFFLQPSIGVTFNAFDIALSSSISRLSFNKINNSVDQNSSYYDELDMIARNSKFFLFEPAITIRGGWKFVKMQLQYILLVNSMKNELSFEPQKISLGIYLSLSKKYWNDRSKK
jgi:hypothetical protein